MIQSADKFVVSDILSVDKDVKFSIPKYQREYAWKRNNWDELISDLIDNDKGHFLGSIICVDQSKDALKTRNLEVIDGQQRITTISILYLAIYDELRELMDENSDDDELKNELYNLKFRLIQKSSKKEPKLVLSEQNKNNHDYLTLLKESDLIDFNNIHTNVGNRRIARAYYFFIDVLNNEDLSNEKYKKFLLDLLNKINSALLVKIEVATVADAFTLFESLNNRGIPLSAIDLIKNNFLSKLEKTSSLGIDESFNKWQAVLDNLTDEKVQERFLRHYYNSFRYNPDINIKGIAKATKSNLIKIFESLIERDAIKIFEDIIKKSEDYNKLIVPDNADSLLRSSLQDLINVNAAPSYQLLMYLLSKKTESAKLKDTIDFLVKYFTRRNLTDFPGTRDLDYIFMNLIVHLEEEGISLEKIKVFLTASDKCSSLSDFKEELSKDIYEINVGVTRFILSKIEESNSQTKEIYTNFWKRDEKKKFIWTVEHIFPQGRNIPKEWVDMVADGNVELAKEIQEKFVNTIGNLTLTGYNSQLSNMSFDRKRDRTDKKDKKVGYKNGLYLNNDLIDAKKWDSESIQIRSKKLISEAIKIFKFEGENE
jgi:uncharacterized protein with ParB-like and HNH nuclease domain